MKGIASDVINVLNEYKSKINIKKRDVPTASRATAKRSSTDDSTVKPEIANSSDVQDEADWKNVFRFAVIRVKEGTAEGITKIVGRDITNPILRTTDNSDFKLVDQYQIHQLFTSITEGAERPEFTDIRRQFVNIAGTIFDWIETVGTNVERMAEMVAKLLGYGMLLYINLCAVVILANKEWAVQQTWGAEISVAHHKIVSKYRYNHSNNADSIREVLQILATAMYVL